MGRSKEDSFFLIGISYKTAPVEIREKLSFENDKLGAALTDLRAIEGVRECVVLSTCNRTEVYATLLAPYKSVQQKIKDYLLSRSGSDSDISCHLYSKEGKQVVEHLFKVICSLDSMIIGEPQIFGQVKSAYSAASDSKTTGTFINRLFHHAFRMGKFIRNTTTIGQGSVSVSYAAVELAQKLFGSLEKKTVLLAGAGKTGEICVRRLADSGVKKICIANRTPTRASDLAVRLGGEAVSFERIYDFCETVDIIITSVSAPAPILTCDTLRQHLVRRDSKPLILIDLGVPRNIEGGISALENVYLYNIDDLEGVISDNLDKRLMEVEKAEELIHQEVENFRSWLGERDTIPVIRDMRNKCEAIRQMELQRIRNKVSPETFETLDLVTRRIIRKILHQPTVTMRASESGADREQLLKSIRELFIEKSGKENDR